MRDEPTPPSEGIEYESSALAGRRRTARFLLSVGVALAAALAVYVLQPHWFAATSATTPPGKPTATPSATPRPKPEPLPHLGDTQRVDNIAITPLDVTYTRGSDAMQANKGDVYAVVTIEFVNRTGGDYTFVPNANCSLPYQCNFYVLDSLLEKNPPVSYDPFHTKLRPVLLADGGRQIGSYTFEVPERDAQAHTLELLYYHSLLLDANNVKRWLLVKPPAHGR